MDAEGRWLEDCGSEDSHGRVLWAMGLHLAALPARERPLGQVMVFVEGLMQMRDFSSPRAWAFALLAIGHFSAIGMARPFLQEIRKELADRLVRLYRSQAAANWHWVEDVVTYDNAKLPEALLMSYADSGNRAYLDTALASLEFLLKQPARFDQQPLEAQAMTAACLRAADVTGNAHWERAAGEIYEWFHGGNEHGLYLALPLTGGCYDGLMENGVNLNQGAESILAYLQSTLDLRKASSRTAAVREDARRAFRPAPAPRDQMLSA